MRHCGSLEPVKLFYSQPPIGVARRMYIRLFGCRNNDEREKVFLKIISTLCNVNIAGCQLWIAEFCKNCNLPFPLIHCYFARYSFILIESLSICDPCHLQNFEDQICSLSAFVISYRASANASCRSDEMRKIC
jgi:hypothetical protein